MVHPEQIAKRFTAEGVEQIDVAYESAFGTFSRGVAEVNVRYATGEPRRFILQSPDKFKTEDGWKIVEAPVPPKNQNVRSGGDAAALIAAVVVAVLAVLAVLAVAAWGSLRVGVVPCNHTCYWCGKSLEAK